MFRYKSMEELQEKLAELGVSLPAADTADVLREPVSAAGLELQNRMVIQPMEGCDGNPDGTPGEQTLLRYDRFASSGAALIWYEATAVREDGRGNPGQLSIREDNWEAFARHADRIRETAAKKFGRAPALVMQLTHSGRYSKPQGKPAPVIAYNNPIFEKDKPIDPSRIITDDDLKALEEKFAEAAKLACRAGFDGVDVKCCHRYLANELCSAYNRPGEYGGSLENRTRFIRNAYRAARGATPSGFVVASRMNLYDGFPYPYGFGVAKDGSTVPELSESLWLAGALREAGLKLLNVTIGNPYVNPHVNRPADMQPYPLEEDPLMGVARMFDCTAQLKKAYPDLTVVGSGSTYLRQFQPLVCAGAIRDGIFDLAGFGRQAFAYPDMIRCLREGEDFDPKLCCVTCGKCSQLMRMGSITGCVVRNRFYTDLYRQKLAEANQK